MQLGSQSKWGLNLKVNQPASFNPCPCLGVHGRSPRLLSIPCLQTHIPVCLEGCRVLSMLKADFGINSAWAAWAQFQVIGFIFDCVVHMQLVKPCVASQLQFIKQRGVHPALMPY